MIYEHACDPTNSFVINNYREKMYSCNIYVIHSKDEKLYILHKKCIWRLAWS